MASNQFSLDPNIQTLKCLQSTDFNDEYIVNTKENNFDLNFNSLISLHSSSVVRISSFKTLDAEIMPSFFNSKGTRKFLFKPHAVEILNLAMSHFKKLNDNYKRNKNRNVKEISFEYLNDSYGDTDIFKTFSDSIYENGYSRLLNLPKFGMESKKTSIPEKEFLIQGCGHSSENETSEESALYFSLKVNIPITINQIIQLCSDTIQIIKNSGENNNDNDNDNNFKDSFARNFLLNCVNSIFVLEQYFDRKTKAKYSEHLLSLLYYNAVLYICNGGLNDKNDVMLFSATPMNYFTLKCFFIFRIGYVQPNTYFSELKLFNKLLFKHLSPKNIHRFLFDAWLCRESCQFNFRRLKRPISLNPAVENFLFNEHSSPRHLISRSSILEVLKMLHKSIDKNERDLSLLMASTTEIPTKKSEFQIKSLRAAIQNNCLNIILLYLCLVHGISWQMIKKLTYDNIIDLILGLTLGNFNIPIAFPHIMGLPSIVLQLLGIQQSRINPFMRSLCEEKKSECIFEFGPFQEILSYSSNDTLMKDNVFLKNIDEAMRERFSSNGLIAGILYAFKTNFFKKSFAESRKENNFETFFQRELNKYKIAEQEGAEVEREKKLKPNCETEIEGKKRIFDEKIWQQKYFRNSPFTSFFTVKKINGDHFQFNNIGDITLMAILSYKKHFDCDLKNICFTQNQMPHFQKLVKDLIIWDYVIHGGFKLPGEEKSTKRFKNDLNLETVVTESKLKLTYPTIYDYRGAKREVSDVDVEGVNKIVEKKHFDFLTMKYNIDMIRVTSLNFVLRSSSEMMFSSSFVNKVNKDYRKEFFLKIVNIIKPNYFGLPHIMLLDEAAKEKIFDEELSTYRDPNREDLAKFFIGREIKSGDKSEDDKNYVEKTRFFIDN
nr:MAG: hypothetical protein [Porcellio scaber clopovirus]